MSNSKHPLVLTILDGWGYRAETTNNAIALARKPTYDKLLREYPNTLIQASDHFVGLPDGQMGNSEVGHLNLGAGRMGCRGAGSASAGVEVTIRTTEASAASPAAVSRTKRARRLHARKRRIDWTHRSGAGTDSSGAAVRRNRRRATGSRMQFAILSTDGR